MKKINAAAYLFFVIVLLLSSCKNPTTDPCATDFDQLAMLKNYGNNIILPSYATFAKQADSLSILTDSFVNNPSATSLVNLQTHFQKTWLQWQKVTIFEFGPAETEQLRFFTNNYPVFTSRLESVLDSNSNDLTPIYYSYIRGLPALDYLLYGVASGNSAIIVKYTTDSKANKRLHYLQKVVALIASKANAVHDAWKPTGANYLYTFSTTQGVANGKPISNLVNQFNESYELLKNNKVGIPVGAKTGYLTNQQNVEALYSRKSLDLLITGVTASQNVFSGAGSLGLDDYLIAANAKKGNEDLSTIINDQYSKILAKLNALQTSSWYDALGNNPNATQAAYAAIQNQIVFAKTDLPSALCISIVYVDNVDDGD